jgi:hypothetical protein
MILTVRMVRASDKGEVDLSKSILSHLDVSLPSVFDSRLSWKGGGDDADRQPGCEAADAPNECHKRSWSDAMNIQRPEWRKPLLIGAIVGMVFPVAWPGGFWINMLAATTAGIAAAIATRLFLRSKARRSQRDAREKTDQSLG